jgi:hypothetical protein
MKTDIEFILYGEMLGKLTKDRWRFMSPHVRISNRCESTRGEPRRIFLTFSDDLDETFVAMFRRKATQESRLLIINEDVSSDRLISKILDLQIRTAHRFYVVEARSRFDRTHFMAFVEALLERLVATVEANAEQGRILDVRIENGVLHAISPNFDRLDVPIADIPDFKKADQTQILNFEIDEDGAFIYWPELDVHLGWPQLQQVVNPDAALKASQKSDNFNKRYGKAVQKVREEQGLNRRDISGLSEKQLARIERGECRLTSNSIEALAKAHKRDRNEYMKKLAEALERRSSAVL